MPKELCNVIGDCYIYKEIDDGWHKCKEDCPNDREEVLVYTSDGEYKVATYHSDMRCFTTLLEYGWDYDSGVNYWIPLPRPPREEAKC